MWERAGEDLRWENCWGGPVATQAGHPGDSVPGVRWTVADGQWTLVHPPAFFSPSPVILKVGFSSSASWRFIRDANSQALPGDHGDQILWERDQGIFFPFHSFYFFLPSEVPERLF